MMSWAELSLKNLTNALSEVSDWEGLGIQLDINFTKLREISKDRSTSEERKRVMLQFWLGSGAKPSWKKLLSALCKMDLKRVAEEIEREYHTPCSTQSEDDSQLTAATTAQSTNDTTADQPSTPPTDQPEETTAMKMSKVKQETEMLVDKYDHLVAKAGVYLSKRQAISPEFLIEFRISVAVLPTSLKYQHKFFLDHHSSQIAKATTVEEIFSILNSYCNFLNCSLLVHIISKFGDEELQTQLNYYMKALQEFRSQTKFSDFLKVYNENPNIPPESVALITKMGSEWKHRTLEDAEEYRKSMAQCSFLTDSALFFQGGRLSSVYLMWHVPKHAIRFLAAAMNSEFLQHHSVEEVTIDGVELQNYKHQYYISHLKFHVISQV